MKWGLLWLPLLLFAALCLVLVKGLFEEKTDVGITLDKPIPIFNLETLSPPYEFYSQERLIGRSYFSQFLGELVPSCRQK